MTKKDFLRMYCFNQASKECVEGCKINCALYNHNGCLSQVLIDTLSDGELNLLVKAIKVSDDFLNKLP